MAPDSPSDRPLWRRYKTRVWIPAAAIAALLCLIPGTLVPILRFDELFGDSEISVLQGIAAFARSGDFLLAALLLGFSVLFPAAKVLAVLWLWFFASPSSDRRSLVGWLEVLGKWSMLDAFVSAVLLGAVQLGLLVEVEVLAGLYLYLTAILLSLVATFLLSALPNLHPDVDPARPRRWLLPVTLLAGTLHGIGLALPMIDVSAGWFWDHRYSFLNGVSALVDEGEYALALVLAVFVVALPLARAVLLTLWRLGLWHSAAAIRRLALLDRLAMGDVFVLALLVMLSKLGKLADAEPMAGLWLLGLGNALGLLDSVAIQRRMD